MQLGYEGCRVEGIAPGLIGNVLGETPQPEIASRAQYRNVLYSMDEREWCRILYVMPRTKRARHGTVFYECDANSQPVKLVDVDQFRNAADQIESCWIVGKRLSP